jgi:hypothetical protein
VNPSTSVVDGEPTRTDAPATRRVLVPVLATVVLGIVTGLVWLWLAEPAQWEARESGIVMTEAASKGQFSVIVVFVIVGAVASLGCGWVLARVLPDLGWMLAPCVVLMTAVAALIAWRVGVELGPQPPGTIAGVEVGDRLPAELAVDAVAPFLVWPIFGLIGLMGAIWADGRRSASDPGHHGLSDPDQVVRS